MTSKDKPTNILTDREQLIDAMKKEFIANTIIAKPILENDLFKFNRYVLGVDKDHQKNEGIVELAQVHKDIGVFVDNNKRKKKLLLIPRGHLKSTFVTIGRSIQAICANPGVRILIANATFNLACSFLNEIKRQLKYNEWIHNIWGDLTIDAESWSRNEITLNRPKIMGNKYHGSGKKEPTVVAKGLESNMTSQHYDIIILDDLVNKDYVNTQEQIQKTIDFYKEALNLLEPNGELIVVGTRWHDNDLYGYLMDKENNIIQDFNVFIRKAYEGNLLRQDPDLKILFPAKFSASHLRKLYEQQGPYVFSCNYLNDPIPDENAVFRQDWFRYYEPNDLRGAILNHFTTVDPAIKIDQDADYTAIITVAIDIHQQIYIREIIRDRLSPSEINNELFRIQAQYHPVIIGIEDVAYQKALRYSLMEEMKRRNAYLPIRELKPGHRDKDSRIKGLQPLYANAQIHHAKVTAKIRYLEDELLRFPRGKYDDIIDALAYGLDIWYPPKQRVSNKWKSKGSYLYGSRS